MNQYELVDEKLKKIKRLLKQDKTITNTRIQEILKEKYGSGITSSYIRLVREDLNILGRTWR